MKLLISATIISSLIFLIIDVIWLSFSVKSFYRPNIGHLLLETPVMWAAILFYLIYVIGLAVVIIEPSLDYQNTQKFLIKAFMFGLVAYGTYNLTNMATIKGWSPNVVFVDMIWGGSLTTFSSYFGILLAKNLYREIGRKLKKSDNPTFWRNRSHLNFFEKTLISFKTFFEFILTIGMKNIPEKYQTNEIEYYDSIIKHGHDHLEKKFKLNEKF